MGASVDRDACLVDSRAGAVPHCDDGGLVKYVFVNAVEAMEGGA